MRSKRTYFYLIIIIAVLILLLHPDMNARRTFEFIEKQNILTELHEETIKNFTSNAIVDCNYHDIIYHDTLPTTSIDGDLIESYRIKEGGEYIPSNCKALFSSAIIVPYRDRAELLRSFLVYMHSFLRRQHIHYRIYIVEQLDSRPYNKAKLINIGAVAAMTAGYPCLILHDVDMLPLSPANIFACTKYPRHMASNINKFRYVLPYMNIISGATAIMTKQFKNVNGMSNKYFGVSGEDDNFFARLKSLNLKPCIFDAQISKYYKYSYKYQRIRYKDNQKLRLTKKEMMEDGLNTLKYTEVATVFHPLFTHIMVDL